MRFWMGAVPDVVIRYDLLHIISNAVILFTVSFYKCDFFFLKDHLTFLNHVHYSIVFT